MLFIMEELDLLFLKKVEEIPQIRYKIRGQGMFYSSIFYHIEINSYFLMKCSDVCETTALSFF